MMQTRDSSAADRLTELDPKDLQVRNRKLITNRENSRLDFTGMLILLHHHHNKVYLFPIYRARYPMMAAQELVCFNINHCMYLTCPVAKIKSTTVEGLQPGHGLRGFVQPPSPQPNLTLGM